METTPFNTRSSLDPKGGLALLVNSLAKMSVQPIQADGNSHFAGILDQKISQTARSASTPNPKPAAPGGKTTEPAATKEVIANSNGEPATGHKTRRTADDHSLSSNRNNKPLNTTAAETPAETIIDSNISGIEDSTFAEGPTSIRFQPVTPSALREEAPPSVAGPAGGKLFSLTEKSEQTEETKSAIPWVKEMMGQAATIPVNGENAPHADPSPTENVSRQIAPPFGPDALSFAQAVNIQETVAATPASREVRPLSDRHADYRSPREGAERRTEPAYMTRAGEIPKQEQDGPATAAAPAKNPINAAAEAPPAPSAPTMTPMIAAAEAPAPPAPAKTPTIAAAEAPVNPASREVHPLSDRHADHRSPREGAERRTDPAYTTRAGEILKQEQDGPATAAAPAKNPINGAAEAPAPAAPAMTPTTAATETTTPPASREVSPLSHRPADHRSPLEGAERRKESAFMPRSGEILKQEQDGPAADSALSDARQANFAHHDQRRRAGESKEGAQITPQQQTTASPVGDGNATTGQAPPEQMTPGGSPEKTITIRNVVTETPGPSHDHQQNRNAPLNHQTRAVERDLFPFRMEMPNAVSPQATPISATVDSTGIEMQAVIDQIREARQVVNNDFGRIRILLNPPDLGAVDLDIVVRGERVEVVMTAENATVQQALQSRGDDIRIALQRQDLKIEGFQVLLQDNGGSQQQTHSGEMYRQDREHRERFNTPENTAPAIPALSSIAGAKSPAGLVSIFA